MTKPYYILDIPAEEYHADARAGRFLSSHLLGDFRKCPLLYRMKTTGKAENEESAAFLLGRATHALILEGDKAYREQFAVSDGPVNPKTGTAYGRATKAYAEWAKGQTLPVLSTKEHGFILSLRDAVALHFDASRLLSGGFPEGTVRTNYEGEPCQIRMDYFSEKNGIVDLKTCDDIDFFTRDFRRYGYAYQLAFYRAILQEVSGHEYPVHVVAVEKREPRRVGVWRLFPLMLDEAEEQNRAAISYLHRCRAESRWPTGYEGVRDIIEL